MPKITLETAISADIHIVFDLVRSIDLHKISTANSGEEAIAGKTSGLIELGETVTWRARHLGVRQTLTSMVTALDSPSYFADEMVRGAFKRFLHEHFFTMENGVTLMVDVFHYTAPLGVLGKLADHIFLERYMTRFLKTRNTIIKQFAESEQWKTIL
ncbi:SRPBCC family protein [Maribacter sp. 2-571]|uniref:SRPBCC family protein n=1 Tax=Maribacter sp. 2-571 TaxID=3417569 RepID=UPI003D341F77